MDGMQDGHVVTDAAALRALYGEPSEPAIAKEIDHVHPHYRAMIEARRHSRGDDGDQRAGRAGMFRHAVILRGFVVVEDDEDAADSGSAGNNRTDSLNNLIDDPRIAAAVPDPRGGGDALRVNVGERRSVWIRTCWRGFRRRGSCLGRGDRGACGTGVCFQCPKALVRSDLWKPRRSMWSGGGCRVPAVFWPILRGDGSAGRKYDAAYPERRAERLRFTDAAPSPGVSRRPSIQSRAGSLPPARARSCTGTGYFNVLVTISSVRSASVSAATRACASSIQLANAGL